MDLRALHEWNLRNPGRIWLTAGFCLLALALGFGGWTVSFLQRSVTEVGTIVPAAQHPDKPNEPLSGAPTFTFIAGDGKPYTVTSVVSTQPPEFAIGESVRVYYQKTDPQGARLASFWQLWFFSFIFGVSGVFFTLAGYLLVLNQRRKLGQRVSDSPLNVVILER